jgi:hypothetical protein
METNQKAMEAKFDALIAKIDISLQDLHRAQGEASPLRLNIMHVLFSLNKGDVCHHLVHSLQ